MIIIALKWLDCGAVVVFRQFRDFIVNFRYISLGASRLHNNLRYFIEICKCFLFFLSLLLVQPPFNGAISFVSTWWQLHCIMNIRIEYKSKLRRGLNSRLLISCTTYYFQYAVWCNGDEYNNDSHEIQAKHSLIRSECVE